MEKKANIFLMNEGCTEIETRLFQKDGYEVESQRYKIASKKESWKPFQPTGRLTLSF